jgi:hypothetical protein
MIAAKLWLVTDWFEKLKSKMRWARDTSTAGTQKMLNKKETRTTDTVSWMTMTRPPTVFQIWLVVKGEDAATWDLENCLAAEFSLVTFAKCGSERALSLTVSFWLIEREGMKQVQTWLKETSESSCVCRVFCRYTVWWVATLEFRGVYNGKPTRPLVAPLSCAPWSFHAAWKWARSWYCLDTILLWHTYSHS